MSTPHFHVDPARRAGKPTTQTLGTLSLALVVFLVAAPVLSSTSLALSAVEVLKASAQTTRYVATTGNDQGGSNACADPEEPCRTVGHAINVALNGDHIQVAQGLYTEPLTIDKSLSLEGAGEGVTFLQAHASPGMADSRTITIPDENEVEVEIAHVTIRHGVAEGDDYPDYNGGGIYFDNGSSGNNSTLTITSVTISDNRAQGAAGFGGGMATTFGTITLHNVTFRNNYALTSGGGLDNVSSATLTDVVFIENTAESRGGGMSIVTTNTLNNVVFIENEAGFGGGLFLDFGFDTNTLNNVLFRGNSASERGGGMHSVGTAFPLLSNVQFTGNWAGALGGGMSNGDRAEPRLVNVTFSGNVAGEGGGAMSNYLDSFPTLNNVIIWNNRAGSSTSDPSASIENDSKSSPFITHSLIANSGGSEDWESSIGVDGGNNIDADPLFSDPPNPSEAPTIEGNVSLTEGSAAIDAGDPDTDPDLFPTDENGDPVDLLGNPRFFGEAIDLGAYEWNPNVADEARPEELAEVLSLPHPNPASASTSLSLRAPNAQHVTVEVFDTLGRRVQTLYDGALTAGTAETLTLDASALPAGVYIVRATGEDFAQTRRVTVVQ